MTKEVNEPKRKAKYRPSRKVYNYVKLSMEELNDGASARKYVLVKPGVDDRGTVHTNLWIGDGMAQAINTIGLFSLITTQ
jgi:hypothetical protein